MIRKLWRAFVPGSLPIVCWWAALLVLLNLVPAALFGVDRVSVVSIVLDATLFVLNLYSWDYQRRARAGEPS